MAQRKKMTDVDFARPGQGVVASTPEAAPPQADAPKKKRILKERAVQQNFYVHPEARLQLQRLGASLSTSTKKVDVNSLGIEALNLLFKKYELPQIAEPPEE